MCKFIRPQILLAILVIMAAGVAVWDFAPVFNKQPGFELFFKGSFHMTPAEIKALYSDLPKEHFDIGGEYGLEYEQTIAGHQATVTYIFVEHGLIIKNYRLYAVDCSFPTKELSIIECQELADSLMPMLMPYFNQDEYDYHGKVRNRDDKYVWTFFGSFLNEDLSIGIYSDKNFGSNKLSLDFINNDWFLKLRYGDMLTENHESFLLSIQRDRDTYGEFDYDKWRDDPETFQEQETSDN